eukprot:6458705-Amphidinium_carterae.2
MVSSSKDLKRASTGSLGPRQVIQGGDWNFEPSDMPIDLVHGGRVVRPMRALGLPAHVKARIVKSLFSVGLYGAEVAGISDQHMKDLRASARGALGPRLMQRSLAEEISGSRTHGSWRPSGDPRVVAGLSTVRVWQRRIAAGKVSWPLPMASWEGDLNRGRGRGLIRNLRQMADRLHWVPTDTGWRQDVSDSRPDFQGLDSRQFPALQLRLSAN